MQISFTEEREKAQEVLKRIHDFCQRDETLDCQGEPQLEGLACDERSRQMMAVIERQVLL